MSVPDVKVVDEIPTSMQKLARLIVRGFYGVEASVLIDLLIRYNCLRESDLREFLRFDNKQLRAVSAALKSNKIIKERQIVEQRVDGMKSTKQYYYFINYRALLSVLKYKIDHMRRKLESEEKTSTHRSTFKCSKCSKTYTDLDINLLWNGEEMVCTFCKSLVDEDTSSLPSQNSRSSLARFNEQMWPFFQLMQELDGVQLALHLLEPSPTIIIHKNKNFVEDRNANGLNIVSDGTAAGQQKAGKNNEVDMYKTGFTVNIEHNEAAEAARIAAASAARQVPLWIQNSTLAGSSMSSVSDENATAALHAAQDSHDAASARKHVDIASALLIHETYAVDKESTSYADKNIKTEPLDDDDFEEVNDGEREDEDNDDDEDLQVSVMGKSYSLAEVMENPELIGKMTTDEKEHYVKISQAAYERMYGE